MNRYDVTTRWTRTWAQRHPVLFELIGIVAAVALVTTAVVLFVWAF